jgi:MFS family permease
MRNNMTAIRDAYTSVLDLGHAFLFLWLGEALAMLGAALMEFALGVWVFQRSGSVLDFSFAMLAAVLPALFVLPIAGSAADYFDRRYVIIAADAVIASAIVVLAFLLWSNNLDILHLYLFNAIVSLAAAFRMPAFKASVSRLLPKEKFVRATGMIEMSTGIMSMLAPLTAGLIMSFAGLSGIVTLNLFVFCLGSLSVFKAFGHLQGHGAQNDKADSSFVGGLVSNFSSAMSFFKLEPLMLGLLFYGVIQGALIAFASTMLTPLVLSHHTTQELGLILTFGSIGGLAGAVTLVTMNKSQHLMRVVLLSDAVLAACVLTAGVNTSVAIYCVIAFIALFSASTAEGCGHALWMRKAPQRRQGSIFAIVGTSTLAMGALVMVSSGLLVDTVLEPALAEGGMLAQSLGVWFGMGKGRGLAVMFAASGALGVVVSLTAFAISQLRRLDEQVADAET